MGFDWEDILGAEGADLAAAYESRVGDAMYGPSRLESYDDSSPICDDSSAAYALTLTERFESALVDIDMLRDALRPLVELTSQLDSLHDGTSQLLAEYEEDDDNRTIDDWEDSLYVQQQDLGELDGKVRTALLAVYRDIHAEEMENLCRTTLDPYASLVVEGRKLSDSPFAPEEAKPLCQQAEDLYGQAETLWGKIAMFPQKSFQWMSLMWEPAAEPQPEAEALMCQVRALERKAAALRAQMNDLQKTNTPPSDADPLGEPLADPEGADPLGEPLAEDEALPF